MRSRCVALGLGLCLGVLPGALRAPEAHASPEGRVEQVTLTRGEHGSEIVIRTSRPLRYESAVIDTPPRLVLDFHEAVFAWRDGPLRPGAGPVREVRGSQFRAGVARVVVALGRVVPHVVESTPAGLRIVFRAPVTAAPSASARAALTPPVPTPPRVAAPAAVPLLYGIVLRGEDSVAYMEDPRTRRITGFKRGDPVGAGVLERIEERHVTVRLPSGPVDIRVDAPKPGGTVPAPVITVAPGAGAR
jgi:hypothetical protein